MCWDDKWDIGWKNASKHFYQTKEEMSSVTGQGQGSVWQYNHNPPPDVWGSQEEGSVPREGGGQKGKDVMDASAADTF